jgi:glycopeptide antibiotics resistance protein
VPAAVTIPSKMIDFGSEHLFIGIGLLGVFLPVLWWRRRSLSFLFFFSVFWFYLLAVASVILFPIVVNTDYPGAIFKPSINLVPFYFKGCFRDTGLCLRGMLENIALTIPFGFGISFLCRVKPKNIPCIALGVGIALELSQLIISMVFRSSFRATDINDTILNGAGVLIGYALFRLFAWFYLTITDHFKIRHSMIFADIHKVVLQTRPVDISKTSEQV